MRVLIFAVFLCIGISPIFVSPQECITNGCITSAAVRPKAAESVLEGTEYVLSTADSVATIGTSLNQFIENIDDRNAFGDLLESTITPALTYLAGVNDTILQPFYPDIAQFINDLVLEFSVDLSLNPEQTAENLVGLLERGILLGSNITRTILDNDTEVEQILDTIMFVLTFPGLRDNITCILTEILSDPSIVALLNEFEMLFNMTYDLNIAEPLLEVFADSSLFNDKFQELQNLIPSSDGLNLCIDAVLTNLVCPNQPRYCQGNCVDTLVYCTALLSQSLQDFSNVLDAVMILAAGFVNSNEFELFFNQFRSELISTVVNSLDIVSTLDVVEFVNTTLTNCELLPLIEQFLVFLNFLPPGANFTQEGVRFLILSSINASVGNISIDPQIVMDSIEGALDLDLIRTNFTNIVAFTPDGFILDGILSLGIHNLLRFRPPFGCGEPSTAGVPPLAFLDFFPFFSNCFDGNSSVYFDPNSLNFGFQPFDFSFESINFSNQAALRTCTFSMQSFFTAGINTTADLCTVFLTLDDDSLTILRYTVETYGRLSFCRSFILGDVTQATTATTATTTFTTTATSPTTSVGTTAPPMIDCVTNDCITSEEIRTLAGGPILEGADYILNTTETVAVVGINLLEFVENIDDRNAFGDLLESTITPVLTYLAGVNDTILRPFYPDIAQFINDLVLEFSVDLSLNPEQTAENLVGLLERGILLGSNITRTILDNDTEVEQILDTIMFVLTFPGLRDNITCILTEILSDPSIVALLNEFEMLFNMTYDLSIAEPLLEVFADSSLFNEKFQELQNLLPSSDGFSLCVDAFLTNLVCPNQRRYCQGNCVDTLVYCTALLSQSLQDFSNVLDAVMILAAGFVNSNEFELFFNQFRSELISTVVNSLDIVSTLDVVEFVNTTLTNCELLPLIEQFLVFLNFLPPGANFTQEGVRFLILSSINASVGNISIDPQTVMDSIEGALNLDLIRTNFTNIVAFTPDGFILDGILSLGIHFTLLFRPPFGCGEPSTAGVPPLAFLDFFPFFSNCFDGNSSVYFDPNSLNFGFQPFDFSFESINYSNQAALRTCTFSMQSFFTARINTTADLCTVFLTLDDDSLTILRYTVETYGRLSFCRSFILGDVTQATTATTATTTATTTQTTTASTTVTTATTFTGTTAAPIIPPMVSFPTDQVIATAGIPFEYPCTATGTAVTVNIVLLNGDQEDFTQVVSEGRSTLSFNSSTSGNFTFSCTGVNTVGSDSASLIIEVRSLSENIDAINNIIPGEIISPEMAVQLLSVLGSVLLSDEVQNDAEQLLSVAGTVVDSLTEGRNISEGEAESALIFLSEVESLPESDVITNPPQIDGDVVTVSVPQAALVVAQAVGQIASNLASQAIPGGVPSVLTSSNINITVSAVIISSLQASIPVNLQSAEGASIDIPSSNFPSGATLSVGASVRRSPLRATPAAGGEIEVSNTPKLNSDLISLDLLVDGVLIDLFKFGPEISFITSSFSGDAEESCVFINIETGEFETTGVDTTILLDGSVSCQPNHTTSFGVLIRSQEIQVSEAETLALSIISYLLLSVSLIFLVVSIILFLIASKKFFKVESNILYFNFAIAMALALSVFIFGIQTAKDSLIGCCIVAFFLHYFWLSVFSWSFGISLFMIYILYFGVFQRRRIWWIIMILGWGLPVPIVFITIAVGVIRGSYATIGDHCFLSYANGLIWGFLGPFVVLMAASMVGAVCATVKIFLTVRQKGDKIEDFEAMKKMAATLLVLIPVLSVPWIIGVVNAFVSIAVTTTILEWVSILLTAPLGLLFFLLVVLRNTQVQEVVFKRKEDGATPSTQQTSGSVSSKFTLPSKAKGSSDAALQKESTSIVNPAYETPNVVAKDADTKDDKPAEKVENEYSTVSNDKESVTKAYTSLDVTGESPAENASPLHQYAELKPEKQ